MAQLRSYTTIEQSKKLAEFLPLESADMRFCFSHTLSGRITGHYPMIGREPSMGTIPCWSLAALLGVLPEGAIENYYVPNLQKENGKYSIAYGNEELLCIADNPIDACYKMVIKLKDMNFL